MISETQWEKKLEGTAKNNLIFSLRSEEIAALNKLLVENNIAVSSVVPLRSLEEYFLQITEKEH